MDHATVALLPPGVGISGTFIYGGTYCRFFFPSPVSCRLPHGVGGGGGNQSNFYSFFYQNKSLDYKNATVGASLIVDIFFSTGYIP